MNERKKNYFRSLLKFACFLHKGETLFVKIPDECEDEIEILRELAFEFQLNSIFFLKIKGYKDIYNFLIDKPSKKEIWNFIDQCEIDEVGNTFSSVKILDFSLSYDDHYYKQKLYYEIFDLYKKYLELDEAKNFNFYDKERLDNVVCSLIVTKSLAEKVTSGDIFALWNYLFKMVPYEELGDILRKIEKRRNYLNDLGIDKLHFETKKGSNFDIGLSKYSFWNSIGLDKFSFNFPSYEIYTSPTMDSIDGKVVVTKPSNLYGNEIHEAYLEFSNGLLTDCYSDNQFWNGLIMNDDNRLRRVGEIALVTDSPISNVNIYTNNVLLDENSGCHIALGNYLDDAVKENCSKKNIFYTSSYHYDLVFGDSSICVESYVEGKKGKTKELILNGKWQI